MRISKLSELEGWKLTSFDTHVAQCIEQGGFTDIRHANDQDIMLHSMWILFCYV